MTVEQFCGVLKNVWGVPNWDMDISTGTTDGVSIVVDHRYKRLTITYSRDFYQQDPVWQVDALIHEFCHMFNYPVYSLLQQAVNGTLITQNHADDILEQCNMQAERVIVRILSDPTLAKARKQYLKESHRIDSKRKK